MLANITVSDHNSTSAEGVRHPLPIDSFLHSEVTITLIQAT